MECYIEGCEVNVDEDYEHFPYCSEKHHEEYAKTVNTTKSNKNKLEEMRKEWVTAPPGKQKYLQARAKMLNQKIEKNEST